MKQFDSRNISRRADKLLSYHIDLLRALDKEFTLDGQFYYCFDREGDDYVKIGYNKRKKLLSRTFNLEVTSVLYDIDFQEDFLLKLQFKGFPHITSAAFRGQKASKKYEAFFQEQAFIESLVCLAEKAEIAYVKIRYYKMARKIEITVCPYAGAFLWIIFPPVFYDMRLKKEEINAVYSTAELIRTYIAGKVGLY